MKIEHRVLGSCEIVRDRHQVEMEMWTAEVKIAGLEGDLDCSVREGNCRSRLGMH